MNLSDDLRGVLRIETQLAVGGSYQGRGSTALFAQEGLHKPCRLVHTEQSGMARRREGTVADSVGDIMGEKPLPRRATLVKPAR